jgi:maltooligosyltrehalose trehalohydrolase
VQAVLGASYNKDRQCCFVVWAKNAATVDLQILTEANRTVALEKMNDGYFAMTVENIRPGTRYFYQLDKRTARPDPASKFQPEGVHGPSEVVDQTFAWTDEKWRGLPLHRHIVYEIHVGTYTAQGTFAALIPHLTELKELGITAIELMPVAQFPGERNWGYDGVYPFSAQNSYGGPNGLKQLVDACHDHGLAVILDVVYNHLGPEGNYLNYFAPYFTDR